MKYKFVLDENVFKHALNRVDKHDKPDDSSMNLIKDISDNCHRIILDKKLNRVFIQVLENVREKSRLNKTKIDDKFIFALKKILVTGQKYLFQDYTAKDIEDFPGVENIPRKDAFMAKLAVKEGADYIVTSDKNFRESIKNNDFLASQKIFPLNVKDALNKSKEN